MRGRLYQAIRNIVFEVLENRTCEFWWRFRREIFVVHNYCFFPAVRAAPIVCWFTPVLFRHIGMYTKFPG